MVALAPEVVARFSDPLPDLDWPRVLLPALLLVAPARGWRLTPKVVSMLSGSWEERVFLHQAAQLPDAQRVAIAGLLWELASHVHALPNEVIPMTMRLARMQNTTRGLLWTDWEDTFAGPVEWDVASIIWNAQLLDHDHATVNAIRDAYGPVDEKALQQCLVARAAVITVWYPILYPNPDADRQDKLRHRIEWLEGVKV